MRLQRETVAAMKWWKRNSLRGKGNGFKYLHSSEFHWSSWRFRVGDIVAKFRNEPTTVG
jgi:hypothetical protein